MTIPEPSREQEQPPPFGGSWRRVYLAVVIYTFVLIVALYWMTVALNH